MNARRTPLRPSARAAVPAAGALLAALVGCSADDDRSSNRPPAATPDATRSEAAVDHSDREEEPVMTIRLTARGRTFTGTLDDSAPARSLYAMLPLTLDFEDLAGEEKWARLPRPLDLTGAPDGAAAEGGGIADAIVAGVPARLIRMTATTPRRAEGLADRRFGRGAVARIRAIPISKGARRPSIG